MPEGKPSDNRCGTDSGYQAHRRRLQPACRPCSNAHAVYMSQWRAKTGQAKKAIVPYHVLGSLLTHAPDSLNQWAWSVLGDAVATNALQAWQEHQREGERSA